MPLNHFTAGGFSRLAPATRAEKVTLPPAGGKGKRLGPGTLWPPSPPLGAASHTHPRSPRRPVAVSGRAQWGHRGWLGSGLGAPAPARPAWPARLWGLGCCLLAQVWLGLLRSQQGQEQGSPLLSLRGGDVEAQALIRDPRSQAPGPKTHPQAPVPVPGSCPAVICPHCVPVCPSSSEVPCPCRSQAVPPHPAPCGSGCWGESCMIQSSVEGGSRSSSIFPTTMADTGPRPMQDSLFPGGDEGKPPLPAGTSNPAFTGHGGAHL